MADTVFDQIHKESSGNVFDQIHAEDQPAPLHTTQYGPLARWLGQDHETPEDPKITASRASTKSKMQQFRADHPIMYGLMHSIMSDAVPAPGITAMEGVAAPVVKPAAEEAAGFFSRLLSHPKVIDAAKDLATEFINEIPGVKTLTKAGKALKTARGVLNDIREPTAGAATRPVGAAAMDAPVEPMTPRFEEMPAVNTASPVNTGSVPMKPAHVSSENGHIIIHDEKGVPLMRVALKDAEAIQTRPEMPSAVAPGAASPQGGTGAMESNSGVNVPRLSSPVAPAEPAAPRTVDEMLQNLRSAIEEKHPDVLTPGKHLGEVPHGSYKERWDEGSGAPTIQSTVKPKSSAVRTVSADSPLAKNQKALEIAQRLADELEVGDMVHLKNGKAVTVKKLNGDGTFEH